MFEPEAGVTTAAVEYRKLGEATWQRTAARIEAVQQNPSAVANIPTPFELPKSAMSW